jgi:iron complex outermembrane receptor protein
MTQLLRNLAGGASLLSLAFVIGVAPATAQTVPPTGTAPNSSETRPKTAGDRAPEESSTPLEAATTANPAAAAKTDADTQTIVVTGTSIRGVAPVGSNLISVGRETIENTNVQTVQQLLKTVPAVVGLGSSGQGSFGSADAAGTNAPTIHGLGASASNSTLIIIDGHRFPLSGVNHTLGDPNIIPPNALERVEVLPDGASSVYGSDAVAGVINFITRRKFNGLEVTGQAGFGDKYRTQQLGAVGGTSWDGGWATVAYNFSHRDALRVRDRDFLAADHRDEAADNGIDLTSATSQNRANFNTFNCDPATIQIGSTIYRNVGGAYGSPVSNAQSNAFCDVTQNNDQIPEETRHSALVKGEQEIGDKLTVGLDLVYSNRKNYQRLSRAANNQQVQATIYGPGSSPPGGPGQINPFFVPVPGSSATSYTVRFTGDELLGPGAYNRSSEEAKYAYAHAEYEITDAWRVSGGAVIGSTDSASRDVGRLCTSCALLALNGTTNQSGSLTAFSVPSTRLIVTRLPLNTSNALDVFNLGAANRTSPAVLASLTDSTVTQLARQTFRQYRAQVNGELVQLPGGMLRVAAGAEALRYTLAQDVTRPLNIGPASTGSSSIRLDYNRKVKSAFVEAYIPVVGPDMNVPMVRSLEVNLAARYDKYSDFGSTKNPKIGATWEIIEGLRARGNWAKSFVAPALTSIGTNGNGTTGETSIAAGPTGLAVPLAAYPGVNLIPGVTCTATTCNIPSSAQGLQINGGNNELQPQKGRTWSLGADFTPTFFRGLRLSATFWHNEIKGGITAPSAVTAVNVAGLQNLLQIFPTGATPAQLATIIGGRPVNTTIPSTVYYTYDFRQRNVLNLIAEGIDAEARYRSRTSWGAYNAGVAISRKTRFDQNFAGGPTFSVLNTTGFNTTFPSIKTDIRADAGVEVGRFGANVYVNHTGVYSNFSGSAINPVVSVGGVPTGDGGDRVRAHTTVDLHLDYKIPSTSILGDSQVYVDVNNLFDREPPFYASTQGYDNFSGNPLMRVVSVGFRSKW